MNEGRAKAGRPGRGAGDIYWPEKVIGDGHEKEAMITSPS